MEAQRGDGVRAPTHSQPSTRRKCVVNTTLRRLCPKGRPGWASGGRSGRPGNSRPHWHSTLPPVVSRYTNYAIPEKVYEPPKNSRRQKDDMTQVPCWEPKHIRATGWSSGPRVRGLYPSINIYITKRWDIYIYIRMYILYNVAFKVKEKLTCLKLSRADILTGKP